MQDRIYFVLCGLINGEDGSYAVTAGGGDDPVQPDGWYFLRAGAADGTGPYESRGAAVIAMESERRFFVFSDDGAPREIPESATVDGDETVVSVSPPDPKRHGARTYRCECYYDDTGVWELVTNAPVDVALKTVRAALETDATLQ